jgi:hypothetical protein
MGYFFCAMQSRLLKGALLCCFFCKVACVVLWMETQSRQAVDFFTYPTSSNYLQLICHALSRKMSIQINRLL